MTPRNVRVEPSPPDEFSTPLAGPSTQRRPRGQYHHPGGHLAHRRLRACADVVVRQHGRCVSLRRAVVRHLVRSKRRARTSGRQASHRPPIPRASHHSTVRPAVDRSQDGGHPALLPMARRERVRAGRSDQRRLGSRRRWAAASRARPARAQRAARRARRRSRAGLATSARRRSARAAVRLWTARRRTLRADDVVGVDRRRDRARVGQGLQGASGADQRTGGRGTARLDRDPPRRRCRAKPATCCSATSGASP